MNAPNVPSRNRLAAWEVKNSLSAASRPNRMEARFLNRLCCIQSSCSRKLLKLAMFAHAADVADVPAGQAGTENVQYVEVQGSILQQAARDSFEVEIERDVEETVGVRPAVPATGGAEDFQFQDRGDGQAFVAERVAGSRPGRRGGCPAERARPARW